MLFAVSLGVCGHWTTFSACRLLCNFITVSFCWTLLPLSRAKKRPSVIWRLICISTVCAAAAKKCTHFCKKNVTGGCAICSVCSFVKHVSTLNNHFKGPASLHIFYMEPQKSTWFCCAQKVRETTYTLQLLYLAISLIIFAPPRHAPAAVFTQLYVVVVRRFFFQNIRWWTSSAGTMWREAGKRPTNHKRSTLSPRQTRVDGKHAT